MNAGICVLAVAIFLGACRPAEQAPPLGEGGEQEARPDLPDADLNASLGELGAAPEFPTNGSPRFVGDWASEPSACASRAWTFSALELRTPAGSVCRFQHVKPVDGSYEVEARCTAEGPERSDRIGIRFDEDGRMRFNSDVLADAELTSCHQAD